MNADLNNAARLERIERCLRQQANAIYRDFSRSDEWAELIADADALRKARSQ